MTTPPAGFAPDDPTPAKAGRRPGQPGDWRRTGRGPSKVGLTVGTLLALLAVGGILAGVLTALRHRPADPFLLTVPIGQYEHRAWPANPWADRDSAVLAGCFPDADGDKSSSTAFNAQQLDQFRDLLKWVAGAEDRLPGGRVLSSAKRPLVVHVTALAVARGDKVYLLPATAAPGEPAGWVPVDEVLDAVRSCQAKHKLLLLDLGHPVADPFGGVLRDDVPARLDEHLKGQAGRQLGYPVLTSCGPNESAVPADPEHCTAFALYLADGLRGAADGYDGQKRDGRVTVRELAAFVAARVHRYARTVYGASQTPQSYFPADPAFDFPVTVGKLARPNPPADRPYPGGLREGWGVRDEAVKEGAASGHPDQLARLTAGLFRTEDRWLRSEVDDRTRSTPPPPVNEWKSYLQKSGGPDPAADLLTKAVAEVGQYRLTVARSRRPTPPKELTEALDQYLSARAAARAAGKPDPAKADEEAKSRAAWQAKAKADPQAAAWLVWDRVQALRLPDQEAGALTQLAAYAEAFDGTAPERLSSEGLLLQLLGRYSFHSRQSLYVYPGVAVGALMRAEYEAGLALAAGPDGFALARGTFDTAEENRTAGQELLFKTGDPKDAETAATRLKQAATGFANARAMVEAWQEANRHLAAATAALVDTMPAALAWDRPKFDRWVRAADQTAALADRVGKAATGGAFDPGELAAEARSAEAVALDLRKEVGDKAAERLLKQPPPRTKPDDLTPWLAVAAAPTAPADARQAVWKVILDERKRWHDDARKQDEADDSADQPVITPAPAGRPAEGAADATAAKRARASVALLRLAGFDRATDLRPIGPALADDLRAAWLKGLPAQAGAAERAGRWAEVERIVRATPPGVTAYRDDPPGRGTRPLPQGVRLWAEVSAYRTFAARQFVADEPFRAQDTEVKLFYAAAGGPARK